MPVTPNPTVTPANGKDRPNHEVINWSIGILVAALVGPWLWALS
jgi:hypothetical protein